MTVRAHLKNGETVDLKYGGTWVLLIWALNNYDALIGDNIFIARSEIARLEQLA